MNQEPRLMQGNEACAEGAIYAGMRFYAGYPITPSTEIAEILARRLPQVNGKFIQMEDEIASMAAVVGASLTGAKSMTATSGPGFSLKQENIGYASMAEIPCVIVNVQRLGPSTGVATAPAQGDVMQARWGTHGDHPVIALVPSSVRETFDLTVRAFNLAERFRVPVILLMDEVIGHMREKVTLPEPGDLPIFNRLKPDCKRDGYYPFRAEIHEAPPMAFFGEGYRYHVTGLFHDESGFATEKSQIIDTQLKRLHQKIYAHLDEIVTYHSDRTEDAELVVIAYGGTARSVARAVKLAREEGLKVGVFRPQTIWPFPEKAVDQLAAAGKKLLVAEMNYGQLLLEVERISRGRCLVTGCLQADGELTKPETILNKIREVYGTCSR
ncbi:2-oxoacid:acceptor oxidoreductase subunit alpha [Desulforamulus ruminis]|uniref:Pyruvate flavodoxin/ferredoxin oxidoreductase domain protein n=1 Tax=Desulforamulus ruminis (strain ATCC 23193 / DSM 2154 / NCIMB 8452 / DL) TaxID=696281 RepID=F6DLH4_DESRL|nr:2-oxoacid:acceptor oxidoreductase subunit alpha [Desulforamulus ruminis]AEG60522.1 pyruvate flavodoxin/ferredoxin oxidoreductase domain protein [Desulforamulus ruminis DSM 2154]